SFSIAPPSPALYTLSLHDALPISLQKGKRVCIASPRADVARELVPRIQAAFPHVSVQGLYAGSRDKSGTAQLIIATTHQLYRYQDRKSTRLNSSHVSISYAVFCLK